MPVFTRAAVLVAAGVATGALPSARDRSQAQPGATYSVIAANGRRALPFRAGATDTVALDELASMFQFTVQEDLLVEGVVGGLTITTSGQRILLIPGQSWAQVSGEVRSLSGQVEGERGAWRVPIDFLSRALGPAIGTAIQVRRGSHLVIVGDIRVPAVTGHIEPQGDAAARLQLDIRPATPHQVTRDGSRITIQFDAAALDMGAITGAAPDFVTSARVAATAIVVELGPRAATAQADTDQDESRLTIDLAAPAPAAPPPGTPAPAPPPIIEPGPAGTIRTVIIDPGHGGDDAGSRGAGGSLEKDVVLQITRQLKATLENRMGMRVLLTRDSDVNVALERRSAMANNTKADVFISLHANASMSSAVVGAQVVSLSLEDYESRATTLATSGARVAELGGGTRAVEVVPWDLAQIPHAGRSATLAAVLARHLLERGVPMLTPEPDRRPLRVLVGTNMPAVLIEMGFLTNPAEERALVTGDRRTLVIDAIVDAIGQLRLGIPEPAREGGGG